MCSASRDQSECAAMVMADCFGFGGRVLRMVPGRFRLVVAGESGGGGPRVSALRSEQVYFFEETFMPQRNDARMTCNRTQTGKKLT
jgi:hypothetical protein